PKTVTGAKVTNASGVVQPTVTAPLQLQPDGFKWIDYDFDKAEWEALGYEVISAGSNCDYQTGPGWGNHALVNFVNGRTKPMLLDARSCSTLNLYDVTFNLQ